MNPVCRPHSVRPNCHKPQPKVALARPSSNALRVHPFAVRLKSSIQHLPSLEGHSYKTPVTFSTAHSISQTFEKVITPSKKPAAAPISIQKPKVYGSPFEDPHALMTIDPRYPDWLKKDIEYANSLEIPPGSEKLNLSGWDFPNEESDPRYPLYYKRTVAGDKYAQDALLSGRIILKKKEN